MIAYHGSKKLFSEFLAPQITGNIASRESDRRCGYGDIYLAAGAALALSYAVKYDGMGYFYIVEIDDDTPTLAAARAAAGGGTKQNCRGRILVSAPGKIKILTVYSVRKKRGQRPETTLVYQA